MSNILFASGNCDSEKYTTVIAFARRGKSFKANQLRIDVVDEKSESVNIELTKISLMKCLEFPDSDSDRVCTSFFSKLKDISFKVFGHTGKQGLTFEFYNPLKRKVRIYITLLGETVDSDSEE
jgi:hypothetical protein